MTDAGRLVSPASAALGVGTAVAALLPDRLGWQGRALTTASAYAAAQSVDGGVIELFSIGSGGGTQVDRAAHVATGTLSWVAVNAAAVPLVRLLPLPRPLAAVAAGALVAKGNDLAIAKITELQAMAAERAATADQSAGSSGAEPAGS